MVQLIIDDKVIEAKEGSTVLQAATQAGIEIPTICYNEELTPLGSCRVCVVEIVTGGRPAITTACTYPVEAGLKVRTDSPVVLEARKLAMELLLAQRPHSSQIQALAKRLGVEQPEFAAAKERDCILCEACVRTCREMVGLDAITFEARGRDHEGEPVMVHSMERCIGCDSCAFICPTEAITVKDVGDTRIITTPSGKLEFKLKKCRVCGQYWAPEKQLEHIAKQSKQSIEIFDVCPSCRD